MSPTNLPALETPSTSCPRGCEACAREILAGDEQDRELLRLRARVADLERVNERQRVLLRRLSRLHDHLCAVERRMMLACQEAALLGMEGP